MNTIDLKGAVEIKAAGTGETSPRVEILAYSGDLMHVDHVGAVVIDLAGLEMGASTNLHVDHDGLLGGIIGAGTTSVRDGKLYVSGALSASSEAAQKIIALHKDGVQFQASVGVTPLKREMVRSITTNGRTITSERSFTYVSAGRLREISVTAMGADPTTSVAIAAKRKAMENVTTDTTTEIDPAVAGERKRIATIAKIAARSADKIDPRELAKLQAQGIDQGWDETKTELEMMKAERPQLRATTFTRGGGIAYGGDVQQTQVIEAALCMNIGLRGSKRDVDDTPQKFAARFYGDRVVDAASAGEYKNFGIHAALFQVLREAGRSVTSYKVSDSTIREAFEADRKIRASAASTLSLPGILGATANKTLLASYEAVNPTWPQFAAVESNADFRTATRFRLTGAGTFQQIAPGGEIKHVGLTEESYTSTLHTDGAMIVLDRQSIVNDDLNAFAAIPRKLGRMAGTAVEKAVYTALLGNASTFFTSGNGNYLTGVTVGTDDSRLNQEGLTNAESTFQLQTDANGDPLGINPTILLVPPQLAATARSLITASEIRNTTANTIYSTGNPFTGRFDIFPSPYLSNANLTGNSSTAWYLLGKSGDIAIMEVAFLQGKQSPTIESGDCDFNTLGMQWRAYLDFGVSMRDPRAGVKSKGAA